MLYVLYYTRHFLSVKSSRIVSARAFVCVLSPCISKMISSALTKIQDKLQMIRRGATSAAADPNNKEKESTYHHVVRRTTSEVDNNARMIIGPCMMTLDDYLANRSKELYKLQVKASSSPAELQGLFKGDDIRSPAGTPKKIRFYDGDIKESVSVNSGAVEAGVNH